MLVPLAALPVRDPLWNLLVQKWLLALAGLSAPVLLARHVLAGRDWVLAGSLAAAGLLLSWPSRWSFDYLASQPYGLALAVALAGLALAEPGGRWGPPWLRRSAGLVVVAAAHWVNAAAGLVLLPLAAARALVDWREGGGRTEIRDRLVVDGGLLLAGLAAGQALLRLNPRSGDYAGWSYSQLVPADQWAGGIAAFARNVAWSSGRWPAVAAGAAAVGIALLLHPASRPHLRSALLRAGALAAAAVAYAGAVALLRWVGENAWHPRYFSPSAVLLQVGAAGLLADGILRFPALARPAGLAAFALLPAAAVAAWGPPSLQGVRADLALAAGRRTEPILAARCDLVAGDYWTVWPAVLHASLALADRGEARRVWGISHRCLPTVPQWRSIPRDRLRVCVAAGESAAAARWAERCGLGPIRRIEPGGAVDVWAPED